MRWSALEDYSTADLLNDYHSVLEALRDLSHVGVYAVDLSQGKAGVSAVKVTMHVLLGNNYVLESSTDFANWTQVGTKFTAQSEVITQECELDVTGRFFRVRQVP